MVREGPLRGGRELVMQEREHGACAHAVVGRLLSSEEMPKLAQDVARNLRRTKGQPPRMNPVRPLCIQHTLMDRPREKGRSCCSASLPLCLPCQWLPLCAHLDHGLMSARPSQVLQDLGRCIWLRHPQAWSRKQSMKHRQTQTRAQAALREPAPVLLTLTATAIVTVMVMEVGCCT